MNTKEMTWLVEIAEDVLLANTSDVPCIFLEDPHVIIAGKCSNFELKQGKKVEIENTLSPDVQGKDVTVLSTIATPWFNVPLENVKEPINKAAQGLARGLARVRQVYETKSAQKLILVRSRVLMENAKGKEFLPGSVHMPDRAVRLLVRYSLRRA